MTDLVALGFPDQGSAILARDEIARLKDEGAIDVVDVVVVARRDDGQLDVTQGHDLIMEGAVGGGILGAFIGLLFLNPIAGAFVGAAAGTLTGSAIDVGIDDDFIYGVSEALTPDSSALFLEIKDAAPDEVGKHLRSLSPSILRTTLTPACEAWLRESLRAE